MRNILSSILQAVITLALLFTVIAAKADTPVALYTDTVTVTDQTDAVRAAAFATALNDVLVKTSGNVAIASLPAIAAAIKQAPQWVQSYHYTNQNNQLQLVAQFDPAQINQLLNAAKQTLWTSARPQTLIWLGINTQGQKQLLGTDSNSFIPAFMISEGTRNGLPVVFPLIDLQDLAAINFDNLSNYQPTAIRQASARYAHDDVLLVAITAPAAGSKDPWQANWTLLQKGAKTDWKTTAIDEKTLIKQGMQQFASTLFAQQSVQPTTAVVDNATTITVYGIKSVKDYSMVNTYLQQLGLVQSVAVTTMAADHVVFNLTLNGTTQALNDVVAAGNILTPATGNDSNNLIYQVNA